VFASIGPIFLVAGALYFINFVVAKVQEKRVHRKEERDLDRVRACRRKLPAMYYKTRTGTRVATLKDLERDWSGPPLDATGLYKKPADDPKGLIDHIRRVQEREKKKGTYRTAFWGFDGNQSSS
jgi:hypothetical protein